MILVKTYGLFAIVLVSIALLAEVFWNYKEQKHVYQKKDTWASLMVFIGFQLSKIITSGYFLVVMEYIARYSVFTLSENLWTFALTFILVDLVYYWFHRLSHTNRFLWAFHFTHHTGQKFNLLTAYRLNWFSFIIIPLFVMPLALAGLPVSFIAISLVLNLFYQFFLHTEMIYKIPFLEGFINTPSAHRVHHAHNKEYLNKNFAGVFVFWDVLFGTYTTENEKPKYGLKSGFVSSNPFVLIGKGFVDYWKHLFQQ